MLKQSLYIKDGIHNVRNSENNATIYDIEFRNSVAALQQRYKHEHFQKRSSLNVM